MLFVSSTWEVNPDHTRISWEAMALFCRHFCDEIDRLGFVMLQATDKGGNSNWIDITKNNIAMIYLKYDPNVGSEPRLTLVSYEVKCLKNGLNMPVHGCDDTYQRLAMDAYSITQPMAHIGLVIVGGYCAGGRDSLCYHRVRALEDHLVPGEKGVSFFATMLLEVISMVGK